MKLQLVCKKYIIFTLPYDEFMGEDKIKDAVRKIQSDNSLPIWKNIKIDAYSYGKEFLYFVYPDEIQKICLAPYALPYLNEYFT